jgi:hypothetical protein
LVNAKRPAIQATAPSNQLGPGTAALISPPDQVIRPNVTSTLILGLDGLALNDEVRLLAHSDQSSEWREILKKNPLSQLRRGAEGFRIPLSWPDDWLKGRLIIDQLKIEITVNDVARKGDHMASAVSRCAVH